MSSLQEKVKEIAEIAASVPENLQVTCFELLLRDYLAAASPKEPPPQKQTTEAAAIGAATESGSEEASSGAERSEPVQADVTQADLHVKARKFMEKYSISISELNNLFYKEGAAIMPLYEDLKTTRMSEAQIRIALLQALHHGLGDGEFIAQIEDIRTECRDRKVLDGTNFAANFKNNKSLFDFDTYSKDTKSIRLSEEGRKELADIIKELQ
ncbi:hypothetical protein [Propionivibrio soli]|uniref:hypothetical protein n=1 Tax=Propionivibrio soli TaxID=2976531 RepID=UPI0021E908B3|nr:hypothetical protein [Propionivibrio soli]